MKLIEEVTDDVTIVEAYGRLDSTTAKEFGDRLIALVQAGRSSIVVDLGNIVLGHAELDRRRVELGVVIFCPPAS